MKVRKKQVSTGKFLNSGKSTKGLNTEESTDLFQLGAKARSLYFLQKNGFLVPPFRVLKYEQLHSVSTDPEKGSDELKTLTSSLIHSSACYAVRSSSAVEDGKEQSFAGQFKTLLGVLPEDIPGAVWEVLNDFRTRSSSAYGQLESSSFGIIIQELIEPDYAGVGFSSHPFDPDDENPQLSVIPGGGESLVSGKYESFLISDTPNGRSYSGLEEQFGGETLGSKTAVEAKSGTQIFHALEPLLPELFRGLKHLEELSGTPVDVEFAVSNRQIYWLQVRPITTIGEKTIAIWDNTAAEANYTELTLPLTQSLVRRSFEFAYGGMANHLGIPVSDPNISAALKNMSGEIHGVLYYNVSAWQQLIAQLPYGKKAALQLPKIWGMDEISLRPKVETSKLKRLLIFFRLIGLLFRRKKLKQRYEEQLSSVLNADPQLNTKSLEELKALYLKTEALLGANWVAPTINGFFALIFLSASKKLLKNTPLSETEPNFLNDILQQQEDVITVQMVRDFQEIIQTIRKQEACLELFRTLDPAAIYEALPVISPEVSKLIGNYLQTFGSKAEKGELKLETIPFHQNPLLFIGYLQKNKDLVSRENRTQLDYKKRIRDFYPIFHPKRYLLQYSVRQAIKRVSDRENFRFDRTRVFDFMRQLFNQLAENLFKEGILSDPQDIHYLSIEEVLDADTTSFKRMIEQRKSDYATYASLEIINRYRETPGGFEAVQSQFDQTDLKGIGCCSGIVSGEVVVYDPQSQENNYTGKIVIADYFEPSDIALFSNASGLISSRGNLLSHTAILCRELGVPSIVGVKGLLQTIHSGDTIQMNGATGQISHTAP